MRRLAALLLALLLLAVPPAAAQTGSGDGGLTQTPPVSGTEDGGDDEGDGEAGGDEASDPAAQLPETGADAWFVALLGLGMVVSGVGLRLRTTDERF